MTPHALTVFWPFCVFIIMLFVIGLYCLLLTYNLVRALIGIELLIKAVTLLFVVVGYVNDHIALTQAFVITMIVLEVVVMVVAAGVIVGLHTYNRSLDVRKLRTLKG
jgi:NADH-quinone oxidoreductase subunit K